jgi:mono/diheme cytochrome c family protein
MAFNPMADLTAEARAQIKAQFALQPSEHCSTCHR